MSDESKEKRQHEHHHPHHHHPHEHPEPAKERPIHPAWWIVLGGVFIFLIVITWTVFL